MVDFTKGPWIIDDHFLSEVQTSDDESIASCWHDQAEGATVTLHGILKCSLEESAANARPIAAAPDMYALAEGVVASYEAHEDGFARQVLRPHYKAALAIIAKAEGQS